MWDIMVFMEAFRISEAQEQAGFVAEVRYRYKSDPEFSEHLFFATLNGAWIAGSSARGKLALIARYKREGFCPGVADILYLQPRGKFSYLAIEMKAADRIDAKDGGLTEEQRGFLLAVNRSGGLGLVAYGADDAMDKFRQYMDLERRIPEVEAV